MIDIDSIEVLAHSATPGPWFFSPMTETVDPEIGAANGTRVATLAAADITKANCAYIAAANPTAVLALIKELKSNTRMFLAACDDLGAVNEKLGLDPNDGGAEPILNAIEELQAAALASGTLLPLGPESMDTPAAETTSQIAADMRAARIGSALTRLLASDPTTLACSDDELSAAVCDASAPAFVREQAAAMLEARSALAGVTAQAQEPAGDTSGAWLRIREAGRMEGISSNETLLRAAASEMDAMQRERDDAVQRAEKAEAERNTLKESLRLVNEDHGLWMARAHAAEDARDNAIDAQMAEFKKAGDSDQAEFNRKWGAMKERAELAEARVKVLEGEANRTLAGEQFFDLLPNQILTS